MKNFVTNEGVINAFVNGLSNEGKNTNKSIFFEGDTIFSYGKHYAMAKKVGSIFLVNDTKYSNTTSKQISILRRNLPSFAVEIMVKNPLGTIEENINYFEQKLDEIEAKLNKTRLYKDFYLAQIEDLRKEKFAYLRLIGAI